MLVRNRQQLITAAMFVLRSRERYQIFKFCSMYGISLFGMWSSVCRKWQCSIIISYVVVILNGTKNPYRNTVASDIKNAILKTRAEKGTPATYWSRSEQEKRLEEVYQKWSRHGGVWSAAAAKVSACVADYGHDRNLHIVSFPKGACRSTRTCEKRLSCTSE